MRTVGQSLLPLEWDHGHPSEECPGEAVTFSQAHAVKTLALVHVPDMRLSIKGVKAFPFFIFPVKKEHTSTVVRACSFSTTLFPSPQAYLSKFGMTHVLV